jgi:hypothetical protein
MSRYSVLSVVGSRLLVGRVPRCAGVWAVNSSGDFAPSGKRRERWAGESKAAAYVRQQMEKAGLEVVIEPFEIQSYALETAVLATGVQKAEILRLGFDPGGDHLGGALIFLESTRDIGAIMKMDLDDKITVTTARGNFNALAAFKKPRAIVSLSPEDYQRLQAAALDNSDTLLADIEKPCCGGLWKLLTAWQDEQILNPVRHVLRAACDCCHNALFLVAPRGFGFFLLHRKAAGAGGGDQDQCSLLFISPGTSA